MYGSGFRKLLCSLAGLVLSLAVPAAAQDSKMIAIDTPAIAGEIPLGTGGVDGSQAGESWYREPDGNRFARNVVSATLTPVLPDPAKANGTAVIVAPGGAFMLLSMDNEGFKVARALADRGIAAFVLKYRLKPTAPSLAQFEKDVAARMSDVGSADSRLSPDEAIAGLGDQIADAKAAYALVRSRAAEWHVDPSRVGMIGFSAGAMTTMVTTLAAPEVNPAFIGPIYGSMEAVTVPADAPPMFAVIASDDPLFGHKGFGLLEAWQAAGKPVEFHMYEHGGHGFGLGKQGTTSPGWFDAFMLWLEVRGFLEPAA